MRYTRCDDVRKSWRWFLQQAGIDPTKYKFEDTRTTFNSYAISHAHFDQALACFALGNTEDVNKRHYSNLELIHSSYGKMVRERIDQLPFQ